MLLSFGEIPEPHEILNIAYSFIQQKKKLWFNEELPIDPVMRVINMLEEQARNVGGNGVKNIQVKILDGVDSEGDDVINVWGMGTIIKLK